MVFEFFIPPNMDSLWSLRIMYFFYKGLARCLHHVGRLQLPHYTHNQKAIDPTYVTIFMFSYSNIFISINDISALNNSYEDTRKEFDFNAFKIVC